MTKALVTFSNPEKNCVVWKEGNNFYLTGVENYHAVYRNAHKVLAFHRRDGFETIEDCVEYVTKNAESRGEEQIISILYE